MKKLAILFLFGFILFSCEEEKGDDYTGNEMTYNLYQSSDFNYTGTILVRELISGDLEITIELSGNKGDSEYFFPAHLHFGTYDNPDSPIAYLLNPVDIQTLKSVTVLGQLSTGTKLTFNDFRDFDGHVKVHLADSGPEYQVILSAGNIGINDNSPQAFKKENMTLCSPYY
jgi:hypothetical protein